MTRLIIISIFALLVSCKPKQQNNDADNKRVSSAEIVGSWEVLYSSRESDPKVGGVFEFTKDQEVIVYQKSGEKEQGQKIYWHLLWMETGEAVFALDTANPIGYKPTPVWETIEMPMVIVIEGDEMQWNFFTRDKPGPVRPSNVAAFRFKRKK
jgi:hypothetical protein